MAQWFWRRRWKCEEFTTMSTTTPTTTTTTDNGQILIRKAHLSLWLRWAKKSSPVPQRTTTLHRRLMHLLEVDFAYSCWIVRVSCPESILSVFLSLPFKVTLDWLPSLIQEVQSQPCGTFVTTRPFFRRNISQWKWPSCYE